MSGTNFCQNISLDIGDVSDKLGESVHGNHACVLVNFEDFGSKSLGNWPTPIYRRFSTVLLRDTRGYDLAADLPDLFRIDFDTEIDLLLLLSP